MNLSVQYAVIEEVLHEFHTGKNPIKANVAAQIILEIQSRTGNETFVCNPVDLKL